MTLARVLLSLGSNLEPRAERIAAAIEHLKHDALTNVVASSMYVTEPVGFRDQPDFLNAVVVGNTVLTAEELFRVCKGIEETLGRQHREQWREREIDIDILLYGDSTLSNERLTIPHPRMAERRFVLVPAAEIAALLVDPVTKNTVAELLRTCADTSRVTVVD